MQMLTQPMSTSASLHRPTVSPSRRCSTRCTAFRSSARQARALLPARTAPCTRRCVRVHASSETEPKNDRPEFGYTRKDAIIIGVGLIGSGYGLKYGLELAGIPDLQAGVYAEMAIFLLACVGWVSTYIFRVATKKMTYVQQLQQYEEAVMKKRLEEMTEEELKALEEDLEKEKKQG